MACKYVFTGVAERERDRIVEYLCHDQSAPHAAAQFLDEIDAVVARIRSFPRLYALSRVPRLAKRGYRACFVSRYVLLYRYDEHGAPDGTDIIRIARILPASSDYAHIV